MWFQLKIEHCNSQDIELFSEQLEEWGALSIMLTDKNDNPVLEPAPGETPLWPDVVIQALFAEACDAQRVQKQLAISYPSFCSTLEIIEDCDWERAWMDDFKPLQFGQKLWICPTWMEPPVPDAVNLMLDPGLAFGTGTHPTTSLCLTWLESANLQNKTLIDYGCGSGVLALAALKLGAHKVYGVDIDPQALQATQDNALSNQIQEARLQVLAPDELHKPTDIVIANILLAPLMGLKERFYTLLNANGLLVVSGLLEEQATQLIETYASAFEPMSTEIHDGWALIVFIKR